MNWFYSKKYAIVTVCINVTIAFFKINNTALNRMEGSHNSFQAMQSLLSRLCRMNLHTILPHLPLVPRSGFFSIYHTHGG
jgi:hypothetical protein